MALTATADLPLYLQMSRYTKGSKAVLELRTKQYLAENAGKPGETTNSTQTNSTGPLHADTSDDALTTGSIGDEDGLSFDALLDAINPLQHIPGVSTLYREITGDELNPAARIVGGGLFGGPVGAGISLLETLVEEASGLDIGEHLVSWFAGEEETSSLTVHAAAPENGAPPASTASGNSVSGNSAPTQQSTPLPTLSPEMFNALLTEPQTTTPSRPVETPATAQVQTHIAPETPVPLNEFAAAMALGLDRYEEDDE